MNAKSRLSLAGILVGLAFALSNFGCGGGEQTAATLPDPISVSVSPASVTVQASTTQQFTATVANDSANKGVTWSVTCSTAPCGSVSPTSTASGAATTYTARSTTPGSSLTVTLTATSVSDTTKSAAATITTPAPQPLAILTTALPNGNVNASYTQALQSSGGTPPVTWALRTGSTLPPGLSLSNSGTISGAPSASGSSSFVVIATDSSVPPQQASQNLSLSINASDTSHNPLLKGHYAFVLSGFSRPAGWGVVYQFLTAGSFEADGAGNLTSGLFDNSDGSAVNQPFTGTYALGGDNRGTMSISVPGGATDVLAFSCGSVSPEGAATKGRISQGLGGSFAGHAAAAGEFELQDTTAFSNSAVSGSYAFALGGWSPNQNQLGADGLFTADGAGNISAGTFDENLDGTPTADQSLTGGYSIPPGSTNGRGTGSLSLAGTIFNFTFYVVSAHKLLFVGHDQANVGVVFIGQALAQSGGPFSNGSLNGTSVFSALMGRNDNATAGLYTFDAKGAMTVLEDENHGGTVTLDATTSVTYSASGNGRVTVASGGSTVSVLYLVSPNEGFILNTDPNGASGFFEPQATGPFTDSSIDGNFFLGVVSPGFASQISSGVAELSDGTINETMDQGRLVGQTSEDTYAVSSNGRATTGSGNEVIYIVSPTKFLMIDVNPADNPPVIKVAEQ
jgi:hypothetical protein